MLSLEVGDATPGLHGLHPPAKQPVAVGGEQRGGVTPVFVDLPTVGGVSVQGVAVVATEAGEHGQVMRATQDVYRVELEHPDVRHGSPKVPNVDPPPRARRGEALGGEGDAPSNAWLDGDHSGFCPESDDERR